MSVVDTGNIFREANSLVDKVQDKLHDEASQHLTGIADLPAVQAHLVEQRDPDAHSPELVQLSPYRRCHLELTP